MMSRRSLLITCSSVVCGLALLPGAGLLSAAEAKIRLAIVTQKSNSLRELSIRELKRLYLGEFVAGPDGKKLIALNHAAGSPDRLGFERAILGMDPDELSRFWIDRKIRGQSGPPKTVGSPELLQRAVAAVAGAVTYVRASEASPELKPLLLNGKRPGDAGYGAEY